MAAFRDLSRQLHAYLSLKVSGGTGIGAGLWESSIQSAVDWGLSQHGFALRRNLLGPAVVCAAGLGASGGLLAVVRIALLSYWMNSYWGGSMAALGGALALGSLIRLFKPQPTQRSRVLLASLFGVSLLILANSRPYEGLAFSLPLCAYFAYQATRAMLRGQKAYATVLPTVVVGIAGLSLMGYYNHRTTGQAFVLPHILNERTYSPLPLFLWQRAKPNFSSAIRHSPRSIRPPQRSTDTRTRSPLLGWSA